MHTGSYGVVDLTVRQIAQLGLPPGAYRIQGVVQHLDGGLVELPDVQTLQVAVRWLHPLRRAAAARRGLVVCLHGWLADVADNGQL